MSKEWLKICPPNTRGRDFAVGDIHGYFSALAQALHHIGFDATRDRLFSVGDLVDRGPQSAQVLQWLARPWFHAVQGNHEAMTLQAIAGSDEAIDRHCAVGGEWLQELAPQEVQAIAQALSALPTAIEVQTSAGAVGVIHADLASDDWQDVRDGRYSAQEWAYCVWSIDRYRQQYSGVVQNIRAVVHGHMTIERMTVLGNVYFIDTHAGGPQAGHFTLLELNTLQAHKGPGGELRKASSRYR